MKPVLKWNGLETQADEAEELGRSQISLAYVTFEVLNEDIINSCFYFSAMNHPWNCWTWRVPPTNFHISFFILLRSAVTMKKLLRMMYLVQWTLVTPSQEVTPRISTDFFFALQITDEGTRTLSFSLSKHWSLDNIVEDKEFLPIP